MEKYRDMTPLHTNKMVKFEKSLYKFCYKPLLDDKVAVIRRLHSRNIIRSGQFKGCSGI